MIETLKQAARPELTTGRITAENGCIHLQLSLSGNEVTLIELTDIHDETDTYIGLNDSLIGY
jgi:xylan 1,4-beta-xylosidase